MNEQIVCPLEPWAPGRDNHREELPLAAAVARYGELTAARENAVHGDAEDVETYNAEAAELLAAILTTLERVLPFTGTCQSEFTPPAAEGQPAITYRCNGVAGHEVDLGSMHGSGTTAWGAHADDAHHPGEATVIRVSEKLRLMKEAIAVACDQRDMVIAAYGELSQALARVRSMEDAWRGVRVLNGGFIADALKRVRSDIPGWARPQAPVPEVAPEPQEAQLPDRTCVCTVDMRDGRIYDREQDCPQHGVGPIDCCCTHLTRAECCARHRSGDCGHHGVRDCPGARDLEWL